MLFCESKLCADIQFMMCNICFLSIAMSSVTCLPSVLAIFELLVLLFIHSSHDNMTTYV